MRNAAYRMALVSACVIGRARSWQMAGSDPALMFYLPAVLGPFEQRLRRFLTACAQRLTGRASFARFVRVTIHAASAVLILALSTACIPPRVHPTQTGKSDSRPHPTPERLQALMADASDYVPDPINEITLSAHPQRVFPGGYVWASCVVPRHYDTGRIEVRGNGQAWNNPLRFQQNRFLLGPLPCGGVEISCAVQTFRGTETRRLQVETGECGG